MSPDERLRRRGATRHGVFTRSDAHDIGLSDRQLRLRVESGALVRQSSHVFTLAGTADTAHQRLLVATLAHGAAAVGRSASWLLGWHDTAPSPPRVARSSRAGARTDDVVLHRFADLAPSDLTTVQSIRTTNATRTLLDLAATVTDAELRTLVLQARRDGLTHRDRLVERYLSLRGSRRRGIERAGRVLGELDSDLALVESDLEHQLLILIARSGLPAPVVQLPVELDGVRYRLDLAYPDQQVAIEGDGFEFHSAHEVFERDRARQNALVLAGWRVLRFTWRQICTEPGVVAAQIRAALDQP